MYLILWLASLVSGPSTDGLGSESYYTREMSERALKAWGCLAWPKLLEAARSPNAEVRTRANRLLGPYRAWALDVRAAAVLVGPEPHIPTLFGDEQLRLRVLRTARAHGLGEGEVYYLDPAHDCYTFWAGMGAQEYFAASLARCRSHFAPGWVFR